MSYSACPLAQFLTWTDGCEVVYIRGQSRATFCNAMNETE